jgi:hypothetical protein
MSRFECIGWKVGVCLLHNCSRNRLCNVRRMDLFNVDGGTKVGEMAGAIYSEAVLPCDTRYMSA